MQEKNKTTNERFQSRFSEEETYHRMVSEIEDYAILRLDLNGNVLNWNKGAEKIKGYREDEILGRNFSIFYRKEDVDAGLPFALIAQAKKEGKATHEGWRLKKDGTMFWGSIVITALHDEEGNVTGFAKVTRDLTEKQHADEALKRNANMLRAANEMLLKSEERMHRMILEVEDYAIILLDTEGYIQNWNRGAEIIKGYSEAEATGQHFRIFYSEDDRRKKLPEQLLKEARRNNKAVFEGWRVRKDGSFFWGSIVITAIHDSRNELIGFSKVTRDLTEKKLLADQILLQNKQLEEFAYIASHDLQEPLRKIKMYSGLVLQQPGNEDWVRRHGERINASAERMSALISDVLRYSQLANDEAMFDIVDLDAVMANISNDLELLIDEKSATLHVDPLPKLFAIPIQMHQLFYNLMHNALKFGDTGVTIRVAVEAEGNTTADATWTRITVSDNGAGFDIRQAPKLFQMFQKSEHKKPGTGIGLAICKRIVENHRGTITVKSEVGKGTDFEIVLPMMSGRDRNTAGLPNDRPHS